MPGNDTSCTGVITPFVPCKDLHHAGIHTIPRICLIISSRARAKITAPLKIRRQGARLGAQVHHSGFFRQATPRRLLARTEPFLEKLKYVIIRQQATVVGLDADSFFCREPISLSNTIQESCEAASVTDH